MFDNNRNTTRFVIALVVMISAFGAVGIVAAETQVDNSTIAIDNSTDSAYADVTTVDDYNGSTAPNVTVSVVGVQPDQDVANGTEIRNVTRSSVANATTESFDFSLTDTERESYDRVEISVSSSGDGTLIASTELGVLQQMTGGGGGLLGGSLGGISVPVILGVLVIGYLAMGRD